MTGVAQSEPCLAHEWAGYGHEGHLRGLHEPTEVGFVAVAEGFSPTVRTHRVSAVNKEYYMTESLEQYLDQQIADLKEQGVFRTFRILEGRQQARARIDGKEVINLSSNNYLGLATH